MNLFFPLTLISDAWKPYLPFALKYPLQLSINHYFRNRLNLRLTGS